MPIYQWRCDACKIEVDVLRKFDDYKKKPLKKECPKQEVKCTHVWERLIGGNQSLIRGPNWKGSKGNW